MRAKSKSSFIEKSQQKRPLNSDKQKSGKQKVLIFADAKGFVIERIRLGVELNDTKTGNGDVQFGEKGEELVETILRP